MFGSSLSNANTPLFRKRPSTFCDESTEQPLLRKNSSNDCRFIPSLIQKNIFDLYQKENNNNSNKMDEETKQFDNFLKKSILKNNIGKPEPQGNTSVQGNKYRKLLCYNNGVHKECDELIVSPERHSEKKKTYEARKIKDTPYKILDAPSLQDDFYYDLVDWSAQNFITIGLVNHVYTLNATTSKSFKVTSYYGDNLVSAVKSNDSGSLMAVATTQGKLDIFDFEKLVPIKAIQGHNSRIGAIAWKENIIASGSRDSQIMLSDIRSRKPFEKKLEGHKQEICGLSFNSFDWTLASGGNDNKVLVWDLAKSSESVRSFEHTAAVKALSWSPHQSGILATGGGSTDKTIKLWNLKTGNLIKSTNTGSQVCCLRFSKSVNELISTHGYSQNQIEIWRVADMDRVATLRGHSERVLYLDMSPNGEDIVTASGDETLRLWKVFPSVRSSPNIIEGKMASMTNCMELR